jgi:hypothetical protein
MLHLLWLQIPLTDTEQLVARKPLCTSTTEEVIPVDFQRDYKKLMTGLI